MISEDLHEMITQHMSGKDLVKMTEVTRNWSMISSDRDKISKNVEFKWHFPTIQNCKEDFNAAKDSKRIYRKINAKYNYRSPKGVWFSVIEKHLNSLEELTLDFRDPPCELTGKTYPKLKHLTLPDVNVDVMKWLEVTEIRNLESLVLHKCSSGSVDMKELLKFIQRQTRLKKLNIYPFIGFIDFYEDYAGEFNHHNFRLDYLKTEGNYFSTLKFLIAQKDNLRVIEIYEVYSETMIRSLIQHFPYLEELTVQFLLDENDEIFKNGFDNINIGTNSKMTSLSIGFVYEISHSATKALLNTCPNVKCVKLLGSDDADVTTNALNFDLIEWMTIYMKKLEIVQFKSIEDDALESYQLLKSKENTTNTNCKINFIELNKK
jgi:hypothetical protein